MAKKKYLGLNEVDVNSDCPNTPNKCHQWTTHEGKDSRTGARTVHTWCKACGSVPK